MFSGDPAGIRGDPWKPRSSAPHGFPWFALFRGNKLFVVLVASLLCLSLHFADKQKNAHLVTVGEHSMPGELAGGKSFRSTLFGNPAILKFSGPVALRHQITLVLPLS